MFLLAIGALIFCLASALVILDDGKLHGITTLMLLTAIAALIVGTAEVAAPHFNEPLQPTQLKSVDTLYVAPANGYRGLALAVKTDSTGQLIVERSFIAAHAIQIAPSVK